MNTRSARSWEDEGRAFLERYESELGRVWLDQVEAETGVRPSLVDCLRWAGAYQVEQATRSMRSAG